MNTAEKIAELSVPEPNTGCRLWLGSLSVGGYARMHGTYAHRIAYELAKGKIPDGLQIDHLCRTRCCVNPDHMEAVTPRVNTLRGNSISSIHHRKTHCKNGHEFTPDNTWMAAGGTVRKCKACSLQGVKRWKEKNPERYRNYYRERNKELWRQQKTSASTTASR